VTASDIVFRGAGGRAAPYMELRVAQRACLKLKTQGADVTASDISSSMAQEAERRYKAAVADAPESRPAAEPKFAAADLESQGGRFHTVSCLDVMIHYPQVRPAFGTWH